MDWPANGNDRAWAVKLRLSDGSIGWRRDWSGYDDSRTYYFLPSPHATAARLRWAMEAGITPESAAEFLSKYADCEGADVRRAVLDADDETKDRLRTAAAEKQAKKRADDIASEIARIRRSAERELVGFEVLEIVIPDRAIEHYVDHNSAVKATGSYRSVDLVEIEGVAIKVKAPVPLPLPSPPTPKRGKKAVIPAVRTVPTEVKIHSYCTAKVFQE